MPASSCLLRQFVWSEITQAEWQSHPCNPPMTPQMNRSNTQPGFFLMVVLKEILGVLGIIYIFRE